MVPGLRNTPGVPRLLSQVRNQPHATAADHAEPLRDYNAKPVRRAATSEKRRSIASEVDINAEPYSSGDESAPTPPVPSFQKPRPSAASLLNNTTSTEGGKDDEDDAYLFGSAGTRAKRPQKPPSVKSMFAAAPASKRPLQYGKRGVSKPMLVGKERRFKKLRDTDDDVGGPKRESAKPKFKSVGGAVARVNSGQDEPVDGAMQVPDDVESDDPELTELSQDICHVCEETVSATIRELFEDRYNCTVKANYRWAQRFCRFHRQQEALQIWEDQGYPEIDWDRLSLRLDTRERTSRLEAILNGERRALFQDTQEGHVKSRKRTALQALGADDDDEQELRSGGAGYYGPRGEKLVTDYILQNFSDKLRTRATKERVITTAGISGGISGFVQAILAPELVVSLIAEDLDQDEVAAMRIMSQTNALGELLHPEGGGEMEAEAEIDPPYA